MVDIDDLLERLKEPLFVLHLYNWVGSIIVFSCIAASRTGSGECVFNLNEKACGEGTLVGVLGFLFASLFLCLEFTWDYVSRYAKEIYLAGIVVSAICSASYGVFAVVFASLWGDTPEYVADDGGVGNARAVIFFCFVNCVAWGFVTYLLFDAYRSDPVIQNAYQSHGYEPVGQSGMQYTDPVTGIGGNAPAPTTAGSYQSADQSESSSQVHGVYSASFLPGNDDGNSSGSGAQAGSQEASGINPDEI